MLFEELIDKKVKCVWNDGDVPKAVSGKIIKIDENFISVLAEKNNNLLHISIKSIISIKEVGE